MAKSASKIIVGAEPWIGWAVAEWASAAPHIPTVAVPLAQNQSYIFDFSPLENFTGKRATGFVAFGDALLNLRRKELIEKMKALGFALPPLIDPEALIATDIVVPENAWIRKGVVIATGVTIGPGLYADIGTQINSGSRLGATVTLGENVRIATGCSLGDGVTIGADVRLQPNTQISSSSRITKPGAYQGTYAATVFIEEQFDATIL